MKHNQETVVRLRRIATGFVLTEMFFVLAIVAVTVAIVFALFGEPTAASRDKRRMSDLSQISRALLLYADEHRGYPPECEWSTDPCWSTLVNGQIERMPVDPVNSAAGDCSTDAGCLVYRYCRLDGGARFIVAANLERPAKTPLGNNPECPLGGPNQHWVTE